MIRERWKNGETIQQIADELQCDRKTIRRAINEGLPERIRERVDGPSGSDRDIKPVSIKKLSVESGKLHFILSDNRELLIPVKDIPEIKSLSPAKRKEVQVFGDNGVFNLFSFVALDLIFRLTDDLRIEVG